MILICVSVGGSLLLLGWDDYSAETRGPLVAGSAVEWPGRLVPKVIRNCHWNIQTCTAKNQVLLVSRRLLHVYDVCCWLMSATGSHLLLARVCCWLTSAAGWRLLLVDVYCAYVDMCSTIVFSHLTAVLLPQSPNLTTPCTTRCQTWRWKK